MLQDFPGLLKAASGKLLFPLLLEGGRRKNDGMQQRRGPEG